MCVLLPVAHVCYRPSATWVMPWCSKERRLLLWAMQNWDNSAFNQPSAPMKPHAHKQTLPKEMTCQACCITGGWGCTPSAAMLRWGEGPGHGRGLRGRNAKMYQARLVK